MPRHIRREAGDRALEISGGDALTRTIDRTLRVRWKYRAILRVHLDGCCTRNSGRTE
jgi:hypothetical protein